MVDTRSVEGEEDKIVFESIGRLCYGYIVQAERTLPYLDLFLVEARKI